MGEPMTYEPIRCDECGYQLVCDGRTMRSFTTKTGGGAICERCEPSGVARMGEPMTAEERLTQHLAEFARALGVEAMRECPYQWDQGHPQGCDGSCHGTGRVPFTTLDEIVHAFNERLGIALGIHERFEWQYSLTLDEIVAAGLAAAQEERDREWRKWLNADDADPSSEKPEGARLAWMSPPTIRPPFVIEADEVVDAGLAPLLKCVESLKALLAVHSGECAKGDDCGAVVKARERLYALPPREGGV